MPDQRFRDGAQAVTAAFEAWMGTGASQARPYEENPGRLIPAEFHSNIARREFYRTMDALAVPHGEPRANKARAFMKDFDQRVALLQQKAVAQDRRRGTATEGLPLSPRKDLRADPAVVTLRLLREWVQAALPNPRPEGKALSSPASRATPEAVKRAREWNHHPVLLDPSGASDRDYSGQFGKMLGVLLAGLVGRSPASDPVEALIQVLSRQGDPADHGRAAALLLSNGKRYGAAVSDWTSLQRLVRHSHAAAVRRHDQLKNEGHPVEASDARDFIRVVLGDEFARRGIAADNARFRNAVSVEAIHRADALFQGSYKSIPVSQETLRQIVADAFAAREVTAPRSAAASTPTQRGAEQSSGREPQALSPGVLNVRQESPVATPASSSPATRMVRRGASAMHAALDTARSRLELAEGANQAFPAPDLAAAREALRTAEGLVNLARAGSKPELWVSGASSRMRALNNRLEQLTASLPGAEGGQTRSGDVPRDHKSGRSESPVRDLKSEFGAAATPGRAFSTPLAEAQEYRESGSQGPADAQPQPAARSAQPAHVTSQKPAAR